MILYMNSYSWKAEIYTALKESSTNKLIQFNLQELETVSFDPFEKLKFKILFSH